MKKGTKSQTTIFIIFAIILVSLILIFFLTKQNILNLNLTINPQIKPINSFVQSCVEQTAENAIYHIGENGGYFITPNLSIENNIPIYINKGQKNIPTKEQIELELSKYIDTMLFFCTKNFQDFQDFKVTQKEIKTTTKINKNNIEFNINYPLSINKNQQTYQLKNFNTKISIRLETIYNTINEITNNYMTEKDICISCINTLLEEHDLYSEMSDYNDETTIFSIIDFNSQINNKEFRFYFAGKFK